MSLYFKKYPWLAWLVLVILATGCTLVIALSQKSGVPAVGLPPSDAPSVELHPVVIQPGPPTPRLDTGLKDYAGKPVSAACSSCHATTRPNITRNTAADLFQSHRGLNYQHGGLTCLSCHNASNYDTLRLADSRPVEFPDVMSLCAQCHGTQKRDYDHGTHGGMNGHWDLTKGGRVRNHCINCHDPHHPAFPLVQPVLPPRDRISVPLDQGSP